MTQRINYSQTNNSGKQLAQAVNNFIEAVAEFQRTTAVLDAMTYDSDWTAAAGQLAVTSTEAQDLWTICATLRDKFASTNAGDLKGALTSLSRLDQG